MIYLEHEEKVLINDTILSKNKDWSLIIPLLIKITDTSFGLDSFNDLIANAYLYQATFGYLYRGYEYVNLDKQIKNTILREFVVPIKVRLNKIPFEKALKKSKTSLEKLLVIISYVTLKTNDITHNYLLHYDPFIYRNIYKFFDIQISNGELKLISQTLKSIGGEFSYNAKIFNSNILKKEYVSNKKFVASMENVVKRKILFNYYYGKEPSQVSYEEHLVAKMPLISISSSGDLVPQSTINGVYPDMTFWDSNNLNNLSAYFRNNPYIDSVIEVIDYLHNKEIPSPNSIELCILNLKYNLNHNKFYYCQGLINLLIKLSKDKKLFKTSKSLFLNEIVPILEKHKYHNNIITNLYKAKLPIGNKLTIRLNKYDEKKFKENMKDIDTITGMINILDSKETISVINKKRYKQIKMSFYKLIGTLTKNDSVYISHLFHSYGRFLVSISGQMVESEIEQDKIALWNEWTNKAFKTCVDGLQKIETSKISVKDTDVDKYSLSILSDPRNFGYHSFSHSNNEFINLISEGSKNPMIKMVNTLLIDELFPKSGTIESTNFLPKIITEQLDNVSEGKRYKFLNQFEPELYLADYYRSVKFDLLFQLSLFRHEKELYEKLKKKYHNSLSRYKSIPDYGSITQLFPLLEHVIVQYGLMLGIFPLREVNGEFIAKKEPTTILLQIFRRAIKQYGSLEPVSDLIMVYVLMYDRYGFNIRNDVVHGNNYPLSKSALNQYYKATLISIGILDKRIETE